MKSLDINKIELQGMSLIEASAGTGKTFTITSLYLLLLMEKNLSVKEILVVTYTVAATSELKSRIRNRLIECLSVLKSEKLMRLLAESLKNSEAKKKRYITWKHPYETLMRLQYILFMDFASRLSMNRLLTVMFSLMQN
jgi:ATP-dependent exoDNAse (exonuclease V) beta subunit